MRITCNFHEDFIKTRPLRWVEKLFGLIYISIYIFHYSLCSSASCLVITQPKLLDIVTNTIITIARVIITTAITTSNHQHLLSLFSLIYPIITSYNHHDQFARIRIRSRKQSTITAAIIVPT